MRTTQWIVFISGFAAAVAGLPTSAHAGEAERWQALFAAVPALPTSLDAVRNSVDVRRAGNKVRVDVADAGLRALQRNVDGLFSGTAWQAAEQIRGQLAQLERDPHAAALVKRIETVIGSKDGAATHVPTMEQLAALNAEVEHALGGNATAANTLPFAEIAAYRVELQGSEPRAAAFVQRLFELQRRYAQLHAEADRTALERAAAADLAALSIETVDAHHKLGEQQLKDAATLLDDARLALAPRFAHMAQLAQAAELEAASPFERNTAYAVLKSFIELLLTVQRETLQDVGFWAATRANVFNGGSGRLYAINGMGDIDLQADGNIDTITAHYPSGREFVMGKLPGIR